MYYTQTQIVNMKMALDAPMSDSDIIKQLINDDKDSDFKIWMKDGERYYDAEQDIQDHDFTQYIDPADPVDSTVAGITHLGVVKKQPNKANNHIVHAYHRRQVIEKVSYLLKNPMTITYDDPLPLNEDINPDEAKAMQRERNERNDKLITMFKNVLGEDFDDMMVDWATGASNKGVEVIHPYFEDGEFKYCILDSRDMIFIYETTKQKKLVEVIRYYEITVNDQKRYRVEWYDSEEVAFWEQTKEGKFMLRETKKHFDVYNDESPEDRRGQGWGRVPFILLKNNTRMQSDLKPIKSLIDDYDKNVSDFSNNFEDIQDAIIVAKGTGDKPSTIRKNLKVFKVACMDENGDMKFLTVEIPHEAKTAHLKNIEENIFTFGMGINPKTDEFGSAPSGVALSWLYMPLDLKAGFLERKMIGALRELFWFVTRYFEITEKLPTELDLSKFKFTFNKHMLSNKTEAIDNALKNKGLVSERTMLENHPDVEDVEDELRQIEAETPAINLGPIEINEPNEDEG